MFERELRKALSLQAHLVLADGRVLEVEVLDLSSSGCRVGTPEFLWEGDKVSLSVPQKGALPASVRWCREGQAGLEFAAEPTESKADSKVPREHERIAINAVIRLRRLGGSNFNVTLQDLSLDGCRVEVVERPKVGEALQVNFPGLATITAKVCWIEGFVAGLEFEQPFHPAVFDLLLQRLK